MECDICLNPFDRSIREPYVLIPCSHTYCHDCIRRLNLKHCKACNQQINSINKNWILIKLVPESSYDRLKSSTSSLLKETNSIRKGYNSVRLDNFDQNSNKLIVFKNEIEIRYKELLERVRLDYQNLTIQLAAIEEKISKDYHEYAFENETLEKKFNDFDRKININELDEAKLKSLYDEITQIKSNINENVEKQNKLDDFSFIHNKKILIEKNLIGELLNKN